MRKILGLALAASVAASCAHNGSFVRVDDVALGRVVVYRNGVAYYERRAKVTGNTLTVAVPPDKVDDFLKSLVVVDAASGEPLAVSFSRQDTGSDGTVTMAIGLPKQGPTDLLLTYITEAPAWKPSYRVVVEPDGKVVLNGWAVVDNTSGEDWRDVVIGVGSSSALSFRYDLWSIRTVAREVLSTQERFAVAPPLGRTAYAEAGGGQQIVAALSDADIPRPPEHPMADDYERATVAAAAEPSLRPASAAPSPRRQAGDARLRETAKKLRESGGVVVIEGTYAEGESDGEARALDRANTVKNRLIEEGVPPAQLQVVSKGKAEAQQGAGVRFVMAAAGGSEGAGESDSPVGESNFVSQRAMTVRRASSVMVSIVKTPTEGEVVYLYDAESERGNDRFAFRAVRFRNPTDSTLETGPLTVYGEGRFIGEGLAEPIPPRATAVVPFALDRQVVVSRETGGEDRIAGLVTLQRGVLTAEMQHLRRTRLKVTNRLTVPTKLFLRHTVQKGWSLVDSPAVFESLGESYLFALDLAAGETRPVEIVEATPMVKTVDLRSPVGIELVKVYLRGTSVDPRFAEKMQGILAIHRELANAREEMASLQQRLADYRVRMDELHVQILSLEAVKTKGELMNHLKAKLKDVSERVQKTTIAVVDLEERSMLARVRLQDEIAELSLDAVALK